MEVRIDQAPRLYSIYKIISGSLIELLEPTYFKSVTVLNTNQGLSNDATLSNFNLDGPFKNPWGGGWGGGGFRIFGDN